MITKSVPASIFGTPRPPNLRGLLTPGDDTGRASSPSTPPRAPRWVKVSGIIVGVLVVLFVILKLTGLGGEHGPSRHLGAGNTTPITVTQTPSGGDSSYGLPGGGFW